MITETDQTRHDAGTAHGENETGMSTVDEVGKAINIFRKFDCPFELNPINIIINMKIYFKFFLFMNFKVIYNNFCLRRSY